VLYLEKQPRSRAFTRERVDLLTLLSGQIAVSIDNAMLYEKLEQKVAERTAELDQEKRRSDEAAAQYPPCRDRRRIEAQRPRGGGTTTASRFSSPTSKASPTSPRPSRRPILVRELDECFNAFDAIVAKHGVEKIKDHRGRLYGRRRPCRCRTRRIPTMWCRQRSRCAP